MNLEIIANLIIFGAAIFSVVTPGVGGGTVGLSVSYAMQVTNNKATIYVYILYKLYMSSPEMTCLVFTLAKISGCLTWMVRQMSDLETNIVSVERVKEYSELESEVSKG